MTATKWAPPDKSYPSTEMKWACILWALALHGPIKDPTGRVMMALAKLLNDLQSPYRPRPVNDKNLQERVKELCAGELYRFAHLAPDGLVYKDLKGRRSYELRLLVPTSLLPPNPLPKLITLTDAQTQLGITNADVRAMAKGGLLGEVTVLDGRSWVKAGKVDSVQADLSRVSAMRKAYGSPVPDDNDNDAADATNGATPTCVAEVSASIVPEVPAAPASTNGSDGHVSEPERSAEPTAASVVDKVLTAGDLLIEVIRAIPLLGADVAPAASPSKDLETALTRYANALEESKRHRKARREAEETATARAREAATLREALKVRDVTIGTLQLRIAELSKGQFVSDNAVRDLERVVKEKPRTGVRV